MDFLPLFHHIQNYSTLVVGGGEIAYRKIQMLLQAGANVTAIAPVFCANITALAAKNEKLTLCERLFVEHDVTDQRIIVAATNDTEVNARVAVLAKSKRIEVNVVDKPDLGTFIFPSIIDRSPIMVAVSSGGRAPVLTRLLRVRLESLVPHAYGRLAALVGKYRSSVKTTFDTVFQRRQFWERVLYGPIAELVFSGKDAQAELRLKSAIDSADVKADTGEVYLVGAGPGDPDLLTFKALRLMQQADVVVYDRLVSEPILNLVRRDAELIHVGKRMADHTLPQEEINELLVRLAQTGKRVLRLKGGDPFIFGRGGEEIDKLADHGIPFQVVPGITAAAGCAAYSGIPLTHRDCAQSVRFVTGHLKDGTTNLPWFELVRPNQTVVFYMGLVGLPVISRELIAHGMSADMPIALIQKGTTPEQRVFEGTLSTIVGIIEKEEVQAPTLIIVGEVVALRRKLKWDRH